MVGTVINKDKVKASELSKEFHINVLFRIITEAVDQNDIGTARQLLKSTNYREELANSLVLWSCACREEIDASLRMLELLHEIKADFNCFGYKGYTPLLLVLDNNRSAIAVFEKLIAVGADVNKKEKCYDETPLAMAARYRELNLVQRLLDAGADAKNGAPLNDISNVLGISSHEFPEYRPIIELLIKAGMPLDTKDFQGNTPLKNFVLKGSWPFVEFLIELGASIYPDIFNDAVQSGNVELVRKLVEKKYCTLPKNIPYCSHSSEFQSSSTSRINLEIFQLLLRSGLSASNFSLTDEVVLKTPQAVKDCLDQDKNLDITIPKIQHPQSRGDSPGEKGCSLAHVAAACATRESLAILIHAGLNIHEQDIDGLTPLHYAAAYANPEAVKLLIFAGAAIDAVDKHGMTPLHRSAKHWTVKDGKLQSVGLPCARVLLYAGSNPELKDQKNRTPLECLYARGDQAQWERTLKEIKPREPEAYKEAPSLKSLTISKIINTPALSQGLSYRNDLPDELSLEIEEFVSQKLSPSPLQPIK